MLKKICSFYLVTHIFITPLYAMDAYSIEREKYTTQALNEIGISQPLRIGYCLSGGSLRAMISSLGFMKGTESIKLTRYCRDISALSGSTWMLGNYYARHTSLSETSDILRINLQRSFFDKFFPTISQIAKNLEFKFKYDREVQMVDLWGGLIAARTMADLDHMANEIKFTDLIPSPEAIPEHLDFIANHPFPIFNAIHPIVNYCCSCCWAPFRSMYYEWFEITPYNMQKVFDDNNPQHRAIDFFDPVQSSSPITLGYMMGLCGSAYSVNAHDITSIFKESIQGLFTQRLTQHFAEEQASQPPSRDRGILLQELLASIRYGRLAPARIEFVNAEPVTLVDAGICCNLPVPPLLERKTNIIIICDASSNAYDKSFPELKKAAHYAVANNQPFPSLNKIIKETDEMIVFQDDDPQLPTLVYFHNPIEFDTTKMAYNPEEFDALCGYMENAVIKNADTIKKIIFDKAQELAAIGA